MTPTTDTLLRLDFGCGLNPIPDHVGVDLYTATPANGILAVDLFDPPSWPWPDSSVDAVYASHFVEHLPLPYLDPADRRRMRYPWCEFVDAVWRILVPGGTFTVVHPNLWSNRAFQDPTHTQFMPLDRWLYTDRGWRALNGLDHPPYPSCDFWTDSQTAGFHGIPEHLVSRGGAFMEFAMLHYVNVAGDIGIVLHAVKDGWEPPAPSPWANLLPDGDGALALNQTGG